MNNQGENSAEAILEEALKKTLALRLMRAKGQVIGDDDLYELEIKICKAIDRANQFKVSLPSDQEIEKEAYKFGEEWEHSDKYFADCNFKSGALWAIEWLRSQEGKKEGK